MSKVFRQRKKMDSLTQIVLGASVGEATLGKKIGNKAILYGAIAGTIPDLDFVYGKFFLDTVAQIDFHRGITHSILFAVGFSPLLGWAVSKIHKKDEATWLEWTNLFFWGFFTHSLLDSFTTWGTKLFYPFSDYPVAFKSIFVIDPIYTLPFLVCVIWLMFLPKNSPKRKKLNNFGLIFSTSYLLLTLVNKQVANGVFEASLEKQEIPILRYSSRPTPLNNILWTVNAETENSFLLGYYSFFDENKNVSFHEIPKNHKLLQEFVNYPKVKTLVKITDDYYTLEKTENGILLNDLRFGQREGWQDGSGKFVFSYFIEKEEQGVKIEQQRNPIKSAKDLLGQFWVRLRGN